MLRKAVYPKVEALLNSIARYLDKMGFSPNQLTLAGLGLNFIAGWIYAAGVIPAAGLMLILAGLADALDGPLARSTGRASRFGAFLDSTIDRYSDFFIFAGLAFHFAVERQLGWVLIVMGIILGSFVTSYAKARAENLIENCGVGIFERAERVILLALASLIPILLPFALWILFIGTHVTALQRIFYTRKMLSEAPPIT